MSYQERLSNSAYQRGMEDMKKAGLNPILAYKSGGATTPSGASYQPRDSISSAISAAQNTASTRNILEQNNNLQANSALQRSQVAQTVESTRRTKLENDAYATMSPAMRAIVLSGSGVSSAAAAASTAGKILRPAGNVLKKKLTPSRLKSVPSYLRSLF